MNATVTDDRRRLVMPPELPAKSAVTVQQIDEDTWLVKRQKRESITMVSIPIIKTLPADPAWDKLESRMVAQHNRNLTAFEE